MSIDLNARPIFPVAASSASWVAIRSRFEDHWPVLAVVLIALDALTLVVAFALAYVIRFHTGVPFMDIPPHSLEAYASLAAWAIPVWLVLFGFHHLYDRQHLFVGFNEYVRVFHACTTGLLVVIVVNFLDTTVFISRGWLLLTWLLLIGLTTGDRFLFRRALRALRRHGWLLTPTIVVGTNEEARAIAEQLIDDAGSGARIIGFVDNTLAPGTPVVGQLEVLTDQRGLPDVLRRSKVREVIVAPTALGREELLDLYRTLGHDEFVALRMSSGLFEILTTGVTVQEVSCIPLMTPRRVRITGADSLVKTTLDYALSVIGLLVLAPVLLLVGALIRLDSPGPIIHRRRVLGRTGKTFDAFKFRTMVVDADAVLDANPELRAAFASGYKLKDDPRVTRIGRFLRRTSLDELPQLVNVLRGEMSLVGPRMIAPDEIPRYGRWRHNLVTVKPGITGPWQVQGRGDISYEDRIRMSMQYIRNYTLWLDLEILLRTIGVVVMGKGAY